MSAFRCWMFILLGAGLVTANVIRPSAQSARPLVSLTVPAQQLPKGCGLEPVVPQRAGTARFVMFPGLYENPWIGVDRPVAASIRQVVDGSAGPTYGLDLGPALRDRLAEDVVESYRARYLSADQQRIEVYAVRFNDPALTRAASLTRLMADPAKDRRPRIVIGAIAVLVFQSTGPGARPTDRSEGCLQAVTNYISALK